MNPPFRAPRRLEKSTVQGRQPAPGDVTSPRQRGESATVFEPAGQRGPCDVRARQRPGVDSEWEEAVVPRRSPRPPLRSNRADRSRAGRRGCRGVAEKAVRASRPPLRSNRGDGSWSRFPRWREGGDSRFEGGPGGPSGEGVGAKSGPRLRTASRAVRAEETSPKSRRLPIRSRARSARGSAIRRSPDTRTGNPTAPCVADRRRAATRADDQAPGPSAA